MICLLFFYIYPLIPIGYAGVYWYTHTFLHSHFVLLWHLSLTHDLRISFASSWLFMMMMMVMMMMLLMLVMMMLMLMCAVNVKRHCSWHGGWCKNFFRSQAAMQEHCVVVAQYNTRIDIQHIAWQLHGGWWKNLHHAVGIP